MAARAEAVEPARCPRCDAAFGCGIDSAGCWCAALTLSAARRVQLAAGYEGCLCETCLAELARLD